MTIGRSGTYVSPGLVENVLHSSSFALQVFPLAGIFNDLYDVVWIARPGIALSCSVRTVMSLPESMNFRFHRITWAVGDSNTAAYCDPNVALGKIE